MGSEIVRPLRTHRWFEVGAMVRWFGGVVVAAADEAALTEAGAIAGTGAGPGFRPLLHSVREVTAMHASSPEILYRVGLSTCTTAVLVPPGMIGIGPLPIDTSLRTGVELTETRNRPAKSECGSMTTR